MKSHRGRVGHEGPNGAKIGGRDISRKRAASSARTGCMGKRLYCGNLPFTATADEVKAMFAEQGRTVTDVHIVTDRETGRSRGFAFVELATDEEAADALKAVDGRMWGGRPLAVKEARDRAPRAPGGGGFGGAPRGPGGGGFGGGGPRGPGGGGFGGGPRGPGGPRTGGPGFRGGPGAGGPPAERRGGFGGGGRDRGGFGGGGFGGGRGYEPPMPPPDFAFEVPPAPPADYSPPQDVDYRDQSDRGKRGRDRRGGRRRGGDDFGSDW